MPFLSIFVAKKLQRLFGQSLKKLQNCKFNSVSNMVSVWENLSNNFKSTRSLSIDRIQNSQLQTISTTSLSIDRAWYKLLYSDGDERQNMWTFIMSVVRFVFVFVNIWTRDKTFIMSVVTFARSSTSTIKHSLNNAMIRLLIFPNQKEEKIGGRRRGAV